MEMAKFQMQLIFDENDVRRSRVRELKAVVKDALENDKEYQALKEKFVAATKVLRTAKGTASRDLGSELDEIQRLQQEIKSNEESMSVEALKLLTKGQSVEVKRKNGARMVAELRVKFRRVKDAGEEE